MFDINFLSITDHGKSQLVEVLITALCRLPVYVDAVTHMSTGWFSDAEIIRLV